jgi:hypothetical protein
VRAAVEETRVRKANAALSSRACHRDVARRAVTKPRDADGRRPLHDDEASPLQMLDQRFATIAAALSAHLRPENCRRGGDAPAQGRRPMVALQAPRHNSTAHAPAPLRPITLAELRECACWVWLHCDSCGRGAAAVVARWIIRLGADASSNQVR